MAFLAELFRLVFSIATSDYAVGFAGALLLLVVLNFEFVRNLWGRNKNVSESEVSTAINAPGFSGPITGNDIGGFDTGISAAGAAGEISHNRVRLDPKSDYDVSINEAVRYIVTRQWDNELDALADSPTMNRMHDATEEIHQKAADGKIIIYGKPGLRSSGPLIPIPREFWFHHGFELLSTFYENPEKCRTEVKEPGYMSSEKFHSLYTSSRAIESIWPRGQ